MPRLSSIGLQAALTAAIMAGDNAKLNLGRRYIRLPYWGTEGHKTLGNFYTSILNAYGNPIKHYGDLDPGLKGIQTGPIKQLLIS